MTSKANVWFIVIFSEAFTLSFLTPLSGIFASNKIIIISTYLVVYFCFLCLFRYIFRCIMEFKPGFKPVRVGRSTIFIYALPCIIVWCLYLIAFFPGVMTSDSIGQWKEMLSGHYSDWHPAVHTFFNYLVTRLWLSPAAVALSQILILSVTFGYGMYTLKKAGVPDKVLYIAAAMFSLNPVNGILSITLWKDILFSSFMLLFTIILMNILIDFDWIKSPANKVLFIFTALGIMLFRHNGAVSFIGTVIVIFFIFRRHIKSYAVCTALVMIIYFIVKGPVYSLARVEPASPSEAFGIPIQQIAAVISCNGEITAAQKSEIDKIMPSHIWGEKYVATNVDYVKFAPGFNRDLISSNKLQFLRVWSGICLQNPKIAVCAYINQTKSIWQLREKGTINTGSLGIDDNNVGLKQAVLWKPLTLIARIAVIATKVPYIVCLFWKPALPMFIMIFTTYAAWARGFRLMPLIILPVLFNIAVLLLSVPAQDFRYLYSSSLAVIPVVIFSLLYPSKIYTENHN